MFGATEDYMDAPLIHIIRQKMHYRYHSEKPHPKWPGEVTRPGASQMSIINREMVLEILGRTGLDPSSGIVCWGLRAGLLGLSVLRGIR